MCFKFSLILIIKSLPVWPIYLVTVIAFDLVHTPFFFVYFVIKQDMCEGIISVEGGNCV